MLFFIYKICFITIGIRNKTQPKIHYKTQNMYNSNFFSDLKIGLDLHVKMETKAYCSSTISHHQSYFLFSLKFLHRKKLLLSQIS